MRFLADGPSIPDELLLARDQGRVVFFCGAGVSMARAKLPDFFGLAKAVTKFLGVPLDHPALRILKEAQEIGQRTGVDGLISADRIFGLLERDFLVSDIEAAVMSAIEPCSNADLSAHKILLDLATTVEGQVRLVTTNFDRLFDECRDGLATYDPSRLPDLTRSSNLHGLVYLHGRSSKDYRDVDGDGLVLSSSDFGRAYLSDGWAMRFFREIIEKYVVIFVGYAADDPPVHYLLEALNKSSREFGGIYAFQGGDLGYASARWEYKGVEAIPYEIADGHQALWSTLEAWAGRARDPIAWTERVVDMATLGPEKLQPHERGQVAHIVSTASGALAFSQREEVPSAKWLCVFDPLRRYATPRRVWSSGEERPFVDPFDLFGLDRDPVPNKVVPDDHYAEREMPKDAWDAFALNKLDRLSQRDENYGVFRGHWASNVPNLPPRLANLGTWISKVANEPCAVWWAVRQTSLHPGIRRAIRWRLEHQRENLPPAVERSWLYLFKYWDSAEESPDVHWFKFAEQIKTQGWNEFALRSFSDTANPHIVVKESLWAGAVPPDSAADENFDLIKLDVEYPNLPRDIEIPDEWLHRVVVCLRRNLQLAVDLEREIGGYGLSFVCPIRAEVSPSISQHERTHGISGWMLHFSRMFERLLALDSEAAAEEFSCWPEHDETIFSRLRVWAAGKHTLVPNRAWAPLILKLPDSAFWGERHARDLLLTMAERWHGQSMSGRRAIERRILRGPDRWGDEGDAHYEERRAWDALNRLNWMASNGLTLVHNLDRINSKLRKSAPEWKPEYADNAARSWESRGGWIQKNIEYAGIASEPLDQVLAKAVQLAGHRGELTEYDPFAGLSKEKPIRAFAALRRAAVRGEYPEWAWRTFLDEDQRKNDSARLSALIGEQILRYPEAEIAGFIRSAARWYRCVAEKLATFDQTLFSRLATKLTNVLSLQSKQSQSGIVRGSKQPDWVMEAINSPTGHVAEALFDDPRTKGLKTNESFPIGWSVLVEGLLNLPGELHRHALVIFARQLSWLFAVDPDWTSRNVLPHLEASNEFDKQAFWSGFLSGNSIKGSELFDILKPHMLEMAKLQTFERRGYGEALAGLILSAWVIRHKETGERWVTDAELRDLLINSDDEFRSHVLWLAERWWSDADEGEKVNAISNLIELLHDVWPRQIAAKSSIISARLCDLVFSSEQHFQQLAKVVLPLLSKADGEHFSLPHLRRAESNVVDRYPEQTLAILYAALPENTSAWPYGIEGTLLRISESDKQLTTDGRLIELRRKWESR